MKKLSKLIGLYLLGQGLLTPSQGMIKTVIDGLSQQYCKTLTRQVIGCYSMQQEERFMQVFSRPIHDNTAKYILKQDEGFRNYILGTLAHLKIDKSTLLDEHLNPLDKYQEIRRLLNSSECGEEWKKFIKINNGSKEYPSLVALGAYHKDLKAGFPLPDRNSQVDFLCETPQGYVTIELQVIKQKYWDDRAVAYIANLYGNQIKKGGKWDEKALSPVIGINLLGDGEIPFWRDGTIMRHYQFQDKHNSSNLHHGLSLVQYSLGDIDTWNHSLFQKNKPLRDVLEFFKEAHKKEEIPPSIDDNLRRGYDLVSVEALKQKKPDLLEQQETFFSNLKAHDAAVMQLGLEKGLEQGKLETARSMIKEKLSDAMIAKITGLPLERIQQLKKD